MRVNLLGPLQVSGDDGADLTPAARKVRQTLAVLVLNAGRVVPFGQLADELWGDAPPASASTALQTYVYQLRKRFSLGNPRGGGAVPVDGPALGTVDGGYRLTLPADDVDVFRCEPLLARARARFRDGDAGTARDTAAEALRLWRGDALADVGGGPVLRAEAVRLAELRTGARHLRIEADLHLGRHHEVLDELTSMAGREPADERALGNLMTALYRTDRRADALRVYRTARERIAAEQGLDPSPRLQALHAAVLTSDEALLRPAARRATVPAPRHPPAPRERLVGRDDELARLTAALAGPERADRPVAVVGGAPGTGTTELCLHVADRVGDAYPDGRLHARLRDDDGRPADPAEILRSFLRGLGATEDQLRLGLADLGRLFRTRTAGLRVLVVLDDVGDAREPAPLLPSGPGCGVLIGGRRRLFVSSSAVHADLAPLSPDDGLRLLESCLPGHRAVMDPDGLRRLAELCRGLPGALFAVASRLRRRPHWTARQAAARLLADGDGDPLGERAGFDRTLATLPPGARPLAAALASPGMPDRLTAALVASALGIGDRQAEDLLEELTESYLLRARPPSVNGRSGYEWEPAARPFAARPGGGVACSA